MSRLLLPLGHALHVRNVMASGLYDVLTEHGWDVRVAAPADLWKPILAATTRRVALYPLPVPSLARRRLRAFLRLGSMVAREHTSSTYKFKLRGLRRRPMERAQIAAWTVWRRLGDPERLAIRIEGLLAPPAAVWTLLDRIRPTLVLWPTLLHSCPADDVVKAARRRGIPVIAQIASFDTLSSKAGFLVRPDALLLWGESSARHAVNEHGFARTQIAVTGPAHYDILLRHGQD